MFEKSICDCCVCPMQFVLEQYKGEEVFIRTDLGSSLIQITEVNNFIVSGIDTFSLGSNNPIQISICNIVFVSPSSATKIPNVKPIQKNTKGECFCCEDPITNVANALEGKEVIIFGVPDDSSLIIEKVGEGIVAGTFVSSPPDLFGPTIIFSSCKIGGIEEMTTSTLFPTNYMSASLKKTICDCCVCPMQLVLEQYKREEIRINLVFGGETTIQITEVKNFIVTGNKPYFYLQYIQCNCTFNHKVTRCQTYTKKYERKMCML
ncbi:hypothetical protein [Chengkuizengella axinellae]|uniref:DUF4280 domain-containing protein n=1 Tax=Chengkuizengella axinellae TaxID=3064388 RepID=A0ABT9J6C1_9BACL|nr:hypothetical protein [Chengkuizengella sp. 2205SS18-9]MDP5277180.1 hypothetical protein [Chengkuizengella sp. 2205SS18-9]